MLTTDEIKKISNIVKNHLNSYFKDNSGVEYDDEGSSISSTNSILSFYFIVDKMISDNLVKKYLTTIKSGLVTILKVPISVTYTKEKITGDISDVCINAIFIVRDNLKLQVGDRVRYINSAASLAKKCPGLSGAEGTIRKESIKPDHFLIDFDGDLSDFVPSGHEKSLKFIAIAQENLEWIEDEEDTNYEKWDESIEIIVPMDDIIKFDDFI